MPMNQQQSSLEPRVSPELTPTATYSKKDGSKIITVPKSPGESSTVPEDHFSREQLFAIQNSMATGEKAQGAISGQNVVDHGLAVTASSGSNEATAAGVNRKKQKRRQKQAARLAAEQHMSTEYVSDGSMYTGHAPNSQSNHQHHVGDLHHKSDYIDQDFDDPEQFEPAEGEDLYYTDDEGRIYQDPYQSGHHSTNGYAANDFMPNGHANKKSKKKKKNNLGSFSNHDLHSNPLGASSTSLSTPPASLAPPPPPPPPPLSTTASRNIQPTSRDRIWNTSTQEERERIKDFWLSLGEEERRSLVKVEKEAVLRKMKEQQKHSCSCTVCGRKRTAIEEELEVLYDAYYEELEQYANHQQARLEDGTPMMPPPRRFNHPMARPPPNKIPPLMSTRQPPRGRIEEVNDDVEEGDDEEYSEEDDDEEELSDEEPEDEPRGPAADFFNFGNSLTVQGGILTVADDLLKNDGKKFIEMMEQLAERRMQREEEAQYAASGLGHPAMGMQQRSHAGHNHGPHPEEEEYDEEEDDDDYGSEEEDDYDDDDDDEMDTMTEEQRMEEGRRMFQIFAARMFEQRVLTAYREKVARERQQKLLEELEEESRLGVQREEKKAKEAQKKKDKKRLQKQVKEEEKAKRDAEKAAEEAIAKAAEQKKLEEQRLKKEEQRRKKEAERKAQEEEKHRKETEKQKRLQDERDRQAEAERKQREQKEREKRKREEARKKEREEREAKEKEARERKEQADRDRKDTEIKAKADKEAKDRAKKDEQISQSLSQTPIQTLKRPSQPGPVSLPPGLHPPFAPAGFPSPHLQVATPVLPKAPTPVRPRQPSQHDSLGSSPKTPQVASSVSQAPGPNNLGTQRSSPGQSNPPGKIPSQQPPLHHPQPSSPMPFPLNHPTNIHPPAGSGFPSMPPIGMNGPPSSQASAMPGIAQRGPLGNDITMFSHQPAPIGSQYRGFNPPNGMPHPSAMNGIRQMQGRGPFMEGSLSSSQQLPPMIGAPNISAQQVIQRDTMPTHSHSRHQSASFEKTSFENHTTAPQAQPIARPMPIQRPSSVAPQQRMDEKKRSSRSDIDDLSNHLGSSALLEDTDEPFTGNASSRRGSIAPGPPRSGRLGFVSSPLFADSTAAAKMDSFNLGGQAASVNTWGAPQMPFGAPGLSGNQTWSNAPGGGWPNNNAFGIIGAPNRSSVSRPVSIRLTICQACRQLTTITKNSNGFHDVNAVLSQVDQLRPTNEPRVQMREMLDICETEGDAHNGGGFFTIQNEGPNRTFVKYEVDGNLPVSGRVGGAPGEIGSPIPGNNMPTFGGPRPFQPSGGISPPTGF